MKNLRIFLFSFFCYYNLSAQQIMPLTSRSAESVELLRRSWVLQQEGYHDEMSILVTQALDRDPDFAVALLYKETDETNEEEVLEKIEQLKAQVTAGEQLFINIWRKAVVTQEDFSAEIHQLRTLFPHDAYLWTQVFYPCLAAQQYETAESVLLATIENEPTFGPAYNLLGLLNRRMKNFEKSKAYYDRYLELEPKLPNAFDSMGDYYMAIEEYDNAIEFFNKAFTMDPKGMAAAKDKIEKARARKEEK